MMENIPRELRICNLCNTADLGDEFHYLFKCNCFSEKRKTCFDRKYFENCNILKFGTLMNLTNKSKIKNFAPLSDISMKMSALLAEKCNSLSHFVDIVYNCFLIMYCIVLIVYYVCI